MTAAACAFRLGGMRRNDKRRNLRLATLVPAVVAIAAFALTENIGAPMQLMDGWTPAMVAILAAQAVLTVVSGKRDVSDKSQTA